MFKLFITCFIFMPFLYSLSFSHCEIPCGIYDDALRIKLMKEHVTTIEKAIQSIAELKKAPELNYNQLIRWVKGKEDHADKIQQIASQYFLTQRIKIPPKNDKKAREKYHVQLSLIHEIMVFSMQAKQHTDLQYSQKILAAISKFEKTLTKHTHKK